MIVVDVETSGLDPQKHSIVSIGALDFSHPGNKFYEECQIFKGAEITQEALAINGFSEVELRDANKKTLKRTIKDFFKWTQGLEEITMAGRNPWFDRDFLKASAERYGLAWMLGHRVIDLHTLCYCHYLKRGMIFPTKHRRTDLDTDATFVYVGLPEESKPHHALTGARMEAEAFSRLIYGQALLKEFKHYSIPDYLT